MQHCQSCGAPARFIAQYNQWWCDRCQRYVAVSAVPAGPPPAPAPPAKSYLWLWLVGGVVFIAGLVLVYILVTNRSQKDFDKLEDDVKGAFEEPAKERARDQVETEFEKQMKKELGEAFEDLGKDIKTPDPE